MQWRRPCARVKEVMPPARVKEVIPPACLVFHRGTVAMASCCCYGVVLFPDVSEVKSVALLDCWTCGYGRVSPSCSCGLTPPIIGLAS